MERGGLEASSLQFAVGVSKAMGKGVLDLQLSIVGAQRKAAIPMRSHAA